MWVSLKRRNRGEPPLPDSSVIDTQQGGLALQVEPPPADAAAPRPGTDARADERPVERP